MERTLYRDGKMICIKTMAMLLFLRQDHFDYKINKLLDKKIDT